MKQFKILFGNSTYLLTEKIIEVEDYENEQTAVDKMIDELENEGCEGCFLSYDELFENGGDYHEDEYIIGGNHGRILYHGGELRIELIV
jgi:hypothetical protein